MQVGVAHRLEIGAVRVQQASQSFGHLRAFPGGPDTVGGQRDGSADHGVQGARRQSRSAGATPVLAKSSTTSAVRAVTSTP